MVLASAEKVVLGSIAFGFFWVLAVFPAVPFLPVGRTAGSLLGALLMVVFRVMTPDEAYAAIDLPILGLLFGTMVVSIYLERADMFKYLGKLLSWKSRGGKDLLCRVCLISALASALFTNDTCCVVLTEFILKVAKQNNLPAQPFLLALATSANIGSAATPIGNPQNLVIAVQSGISFGKFLKGILPAMIVAVLVNIVILICSFWKVLSMEKDVEVAATVGEVAGDDDVASHRFSPAKMSHLNSMNSEEWNSTMETVVQSSLMNGNSAQSGTRVLSRNISSGREDDIRSASSGGIESLRISSASKEIVGSEGPFPRGEEDISAIRIRRSQENHIHDSREVFPFESSNEKVSFIQSWRRLLWKISVYLVTIGMLISLLMGLNMSWTAITAALVLVVIDFKDARPCLEKVSYSLLIFFCGMFITVDGFNKTGIPNALWDLVEPHAKIDNAGGVALLAIVILVLSNVASNVPTVLLLGAKVAASASSISPAYESRAWLILAWVSTVAGNLSLLGSAANLIVCEQARGAQYFRYNLSFWSHLRFGLPSTLVITAIGLLLITSY